MGVKKDIYCERAFIERAINNDAMKENVTCLIRTLTNTNACFHVDVSKGNIYAMNGVKPKFKDKTEEFLYKEIFLKKTLKSCGSFVPGYDFSDLENFISQSNKTLNGIYLTSLDKAKSKLMAEKYGVYVLSSDCVESYLACTKDRGIAVKQYEDLSWRTILNDKILPCNSLIIVDNYLLSDNKIFKNFREKIRFNLTPILKLFLKNTSLCTDFQITIVTSLYQGQDINNRPIYFNVQPRFNIIQKEIDKIKKTRKLSYNIKLNIVKGIRSHDRAIITNNMQINCGLGFDLLIRSRRDKRKRVAREMTTINVYYPFFDTNTDLAYNTYNNYITSIKDKIIDKKTMATIIPSFISDQDKSFIYPDNLNISRIIK